MQRDGWCAEVAWYIAITFGVTWSLAGAMFAFPGWIEAHLGPVNSANPIFWLAVWAPNIAAVSLVFARGGHAGLKDLFARLVRWRVAPWVWAAALGFYPALMAVVQLVGLVFGRPLASLDTWFAAAGGFLSLYIFALGPLGEELGWRGYLLPRMLERLNPLAASLVVGVVWMAWHLPAFFIAGLPQADMALAIFLVGGLALSVFITWLFVNARQSVLVAGIVPHAIVNAYGDATGAMTWINAIVLAAGATLLGLILGPQLRVDSPRLQDRT